MIRERGSKTETRERVKLRERMSKKKREIG